MQRSISLEYQIKPPPLIKSDTLVNRMGGGSLFSNLKKSVAEFCVLLTKLSVWHLCNGVVVYSPVLKNLLQNFVFF